MKELFYPFFMCLNEFLGPKNSKIYVWFLTLWLEIKILMKIITRDQCWPTQTPSSGKNYFCYISKTAQDIVKNFFLISKFPKHFNIHLNQTNLRLVGTKSKKKLVDYAWNNLYLSSG